MSAGCRLDAVGGWYGRLGNDLMCVYRLLLDIELGKIAGATIPVHPFLSSRRLGRLECSHSISKRIKDIYDEAHGSSNTPKAKREWLDCETGVIRAARALFVPSHLTVSPLDDDCLVIHLRSGDTARIGFTHGEYVLPPLSFYRAIIEKGFANSRIVILCEDRVNPCLGELLRLYPRAEHQLRNLRGDVVVMLAARHLVCSTGSLASSIATISSNLRTIYVPSHISAGHVAFLPSWVDVVWSDLSDYVRHVTPWRYDQRTARILLEWNGSVGGETPIYCGQGNEALPTGRPNIAGGWMRVPTRRPSW